MMHATEWIQQHARYKRTITAVALRVGLRREKGHCTWCDKKFCDSNARRWCSGTCREEGYVRFGFWRGLVERRDKGVCVLCGFDALACQNRVKEIYHKSKGGGWDHGKGDWARSHCHSFQRIRKFTRRTGIGPTGQPYEVDHIVPVVEGGGCCGLDNLRTLCFPCHKTETKALAGRRATQRRDRKRPLFERTRWNLT